jgi:hypothetical protein
MLPICVGDIHGTGSFFGDRPEDLYVTAFVFFAGEKTDRGVGVGSTRAQVQRAYGSDLQIASGFEDEGVYGLYVVGAKQLGGAFSPSIFFLLRTPQRLATVTRMEYAPLQQVNLGRLAESTDPC